MSLELRRKRDALPRGARRRRFFPQATSDGPSGRRGVVRGGGACRGPPRPTPRRLNGKCAFTEKARTLTNSPPPAQSFHDVDNVLVNYFTFRALKETLGQIAETDLTPNKEEYKCAPDHSPDPRAKMILEADACDAPPKKFPPPEVLRLASSGTRFCLLTLETARRFRPVPSHSAGGSTSSPRRTTPTIVKSS